MEAKDTVKRVEPHSRSIGCPHCGEEFGIEDFVQGEREEQAEISFKAGERKVVEALRQLNLFVGNCPPIEGEAYVYLGDYILRYGKNLEPQVGLYRLSDLPEWQAFLKSEGIE